VRSLSNDWKDSLAKFFRYPVVGEDGSIHLLGVGNPLRGDDAAGIFLVEQLARRFRSARLRGIVIHPPVSSPELLISKLIPARNEILIFDSVEQNAKPGSITFRNLDSSRFGFFATHNVPLKLCTGPSGDTKNSFVLGIEPESLEIGEGLSETVQGAVSEIMLELSNLIEQRIGIARAKRNS